MKVGGELSVACDCAIAASIAVVIAMVYQMAGMGEDRQAHNRENPDDVPEFYAAGEDSFDLKQGSLPLKKSPDS